MALLWPWSVVDPLNPLRAIETFSHFFEKPWQELFDGALIEPPDMPRSYVPIAARPEAAGNVPGPRIARASWARLIAARPARHRAAAARDLSVRRACGHPADRGHGDRAAGDVQRHPAFRVRAAAACGRGRARRGLHRRARAARLAARRMLAVAPSLSRRPCACR